MATVLTIRKLPEAVQASLRRRAARTGRSVEAEARAILSSACLPRMDSTWWKGLEKRRLARTPQKLKLKSAELILEGRDERR